MSDVKATRSTRKGRTGGAGITLYAVAFVSMLFAGAILAFAAKQLFRTTVTLWASVAFSALAVVLALASLFSGRRR